MEESTAAVPSLDALHKFHLSLSGRAWTIRHAGLVLSYEDEAAYLRALREKRNTVPYGVALWPAALALAHELASRAEDGELTGRRVLELGAGTGLPGIVAASLGAARVVQTDLSPVALALCQQNGIQNQCVGIEYRQTDWTNWTDTGTYDVIVGSDILYAEPMHTHLRQILTGALAAGGTVLIADPFRPASVRFLESLEKAGWQVSFSKWSLGEAVLPRPIGVFQLRRSE